MTKNRKNYPYLPVTETIHQLRLNPEAKMTKSMIVIIEPTAAGIHAIGPAAATISKQRITLKLEPEFWTALDEICIREQSSIHAVCTAVYMTNSYGLPLDKAVRLFVSDYFHRAATEEGHARAGHGTAYMSANLKQSIH